MSLTLGSLFDGIGVFPLAASRHGIIPVWASEIEKVPISITKRHFPDMLHLGDITKLKGSEIPPPIFRNVHHHGPFPEMQPEIHLDLPPQNHPPESLLLSQTAPS